MVLAGILLCPPARALVALNDGHDRIYVSANMGVSHDSNVFAQNGGKGDLLYTTGFTADYTRRAGWIGVNANVGVSGAHYGTLKGQDYTDPTFSLEFTKQTGRTTGSITLSAQRETRADAAVNTRNSSWNINYGANFRYHIIGTWDLAGGFGFSQRKYQDSVTFSNLNTFSSSFDLFHLLSSERDVILGYRYRYNETPGGTWSTDHDFNAGLHGKLIAGMNGTVRVGYQVRQPHGGTTHGATFQSWTASGSTSYAINKKINLSASLSKDFSITATDSSVDALMASLDGQYAYSSHWSVSSSIGGGTTRFLGQGGRIVLDPGPPPLLGKQRQDTNVNWNAAINYSLNEHLKVALTYLWFKNWSTSSFADFVRSSWSTSVSSRW